MSFADLDLLGADYVGGPAADAIAAGNRDENALTDMEFAARHPERKGAKIKPGEAALAKEWTSLRDSIVRPALRAPAKLPTAPAAALASEAAASAPAPLAAPAPLVVPVVPAATPAVPAFDATPMTDVISTFPWMPQIPVPSFTISPQAPQAAPPPQTAAASTPAAQGEEIPLGLKLGGGAVLAYALYRLLRKS